RDLARIGKSAVTKDVLVLQQPGDGEGLAAAELDGGLRSAHCQGRHLNRVVAACAKLNRTLRRELTDLWPHAQADAIAAQDRRHEGKRDAVLLIGNGDRV